MEDVLDVYQRPYDAKRPVVCVDEKSKALRAEARDPQPLRPGRVRREDYEYVREGTANVFTAFEPLANWRRLKATDRRTKQDFAAFVKELVDGRYRHVERVVLVLDNLNTHSPASLYERFEPEEAKRITQKLEIHHTPKHGSWLNMAEIELSVVSRRLSPRIGSVERLGRELAACERERNQAGRGVDWQFTTPDARVRLKRLYPSLEVR